MAPNLGLVPIALLVAQRSCTFSVASAQDGLTAGRTFAVANLVATVAMKMQKEFREGQAKQRTRFAVRGAEGRVRAGWGLALAAKEGDSATDLLNNSRVGCKLFWRQVTEVLPASQECCLPLALGEQDLAFTWPVPRALAPGLEAEILGPDL